MTPSGFTPVETSQVQYAQAISQVITNPTVLGATGDAADLPPDPRHVRADPSPNAPLIEVIANAASADEARRRAQAAAEAVVAYTDDRADQLGFQAVVLAPAADGEPAGLSLAAYLVAGVAMGVALGGLIAMLLGEPATPSSQRANNGATATNPWPALRRRGRRPEAAGEDRAVVMTRHRVRAGPRS